MPVPTPRAVPRRHRFDDLDTDGIPPDIERRIVDARKEIESPDPMRAYLLANAVQLEGCNMQEHGLTSTARDVGARMVAIAERVMRIAVDAGAFPEREND